MSVYRVAVPINGVQVFQVEDVDNPQQAFDAILSGAVEPIDAGSVDLDLDTNNWDCEGTWYDGWEGEGQNPGDSPDNSPKNDPNEALSDSEAPSDAPDDSPSAADGASSEGQQTFGPAVGAAPVVPVKKHTYDQRTCSDGITRKHDDVFYDSRDNAHGNPVERHKADIAVVTEILMKEGAWVTDYTTGAHDITDYADGYKYIVNEQRDTWHGPVKEWIQDNYDHTMEVDKELTSRICDAIDGDSDFESVYNGGGYIAYADDGCCLYCVDIGEYENQMELADHPELRVLHNQMRLDDILDDVRCDVYVGRSRKRTLVKDTGRYESTGRETYDDGSEYPNLMTYHNPGGRWDYVVSVDRMRRLYYAAIVDYLRYIDNND